MKTLSKIITLIIIIFSYSVIIASAKEYDNKLYFTSNGDRLYYDTKLFDSAIFMHHIDMVPGKSYEDKLLIENSTNINYKLYFKVKEKKQTELQNELLDNIYMEIYLEDSLIYKGKAKGLDYNNNGVDLQNSIFLGEYSSGKENELIVKTTFNKDYNNYNNDEASFIEWQFYAVYDDQIIPINPDTGTNTRDFINITIITGIVLISMICFLIIKKLHRNMLSFI